MTNLTEAEHKAISDGIRATKARLIAERPGCPLAGTANAPAPEPPRERKTREPIPPDKAQAQQALSIVMSEMYQRNAQFGWPVGSPEPEPTPPAPARRPVVITETVSPEPATAPQAQADPEPAPDSPSWIERYQAASIEERQGMDEQSRRGKVDCGMSVKPEPAPDPATAAPPARPRALSITKYRLAGQSWIDQYRDATERGDLRKRAQLEADIASGKRSLRE